MSIDARSLVDSLYTALSAVDLDALVGLYDAAVRHGMTIGEIATMVT